MKKIIYNNLDLNKYKEAIEIHHKGILVIYSNPNTQAKLRTKNGLIQKSQIIFLIIPGGGYRKVSERESYPIAKKFFSLGYSSAILTYSILTQYTDESIQYIQCSQSLQIISTYFKKIVLVGFSAGGHLAGLLGTAPLEDRFNAFAMILCYPVISFEKYAHLDSRRNFLGEKNENNKILQKEFSIDQRVNNNTLPTFIWTLKDDKTVPYENTRLMIKQLKKYEIPYESKIFEHGVHGISLADEYTAIPGNKEFINPEIAKWVDTGCKFAENILKTR